MERFYVNTENSSLRNFHVGLQFAIEIARAPLPETSFSPITFMKLPSIESGDDMLGHKDNHARNLIAGVPRGGLEVMMRKHLIPFQFHDYKAAITHGNILAFGAREIVHFNISS
jgi:hypothetical protein